MKDARRATLELAQAGHPPALLAVAKLYLAGLGVKRSSREAARLAERAAEKDYGPAMNWLGDRYASGDLAAVDLDLAAFDWYLRAAQRSDRDAMFNLFRCYDQGKGTRADQGLALTMLRRAVDAKHEQALVTLGGFYLDGVRVPHSASKGTELLEAARTLHGSVPAAAELSRRLQQGLGVPRDKKRARELKRWIRSKRSRVKRWLLLGLTAGAGLIAIVLLARAVFVL